MARLIGARARFVALDVAAPDAPARAAASLTTPLDALVNNAGTSFDGFDADVARRTLETNYRGAVRTTDAFRAHLTEASNLVMVSSGMGELSRFSPELRRRFLDPALSRAGLDALVAEFVERVASGAHDLGGFPRNAYGVSKAALNAFTRILARELPAGQRVNAVCPGWVRTRMGGSGAPRTLEQGVRGIVWAATLGADGPNGGFFRDGREIEW